MNAHTKLEAIRTRILHKLTYAIGKDQWWPSAMTGCAPPFWPCVTHH